MVLHLSGKPQKSTSGLNPLQRPHEILHADGNRLPKLFATSLYQEKQTAAYNSNEFLKRAVNSRCALKTRTQPNDIIY